MNPKKPAMKQLLTITLALMSMLCYSQYETDTTYLNSKLNKTKKSRAVYFRVSFLDLGGVYHSKIYTINNIPYSFGTYLDSRFLVPHGNVVKFYANGTPKDTATYISGALNGMVKSYYESGKIKRFERYYKDSLVGGLYYKPDGSDTIYPSYMSLPKYKDGFSELNRFIQRNLNYPRDAARKGIQGIVYVGFIVNKEGTVSSVKVIRSPDPSLDIEAQRIINLTSRNWLPGYAEGEPTDMGVTVPVYFLLQQ
jgi:TonB family protein